MLSRDDCLAKAVELECRAEAEPNSDRNYRYMAAAWRRLAVQSEWQDKLLAIIDSAVELCADRQFPVTRGPLPPRNPEATFNHTHTPGRFVFTSP